jgi:DNA-directed RNA polymerase alpha subunit
LILAAKETEMRCDKCGAIYVRKQDAQDVKFGDPAFALPALKMAPIEALDLCVRARNCLLIFDPPILTIGDLCRLTEQDLRESRNCGEATIKDFKSRLHAVGLQLKEIPR